MGRSCPHLAFGIQVADSLPPAHTTTTLLTAAAGRVCSSPGPQERVCPGVSNSAMTLMPRSRAYSITVCTSLAVYTWVIALKAPWGTQEISEPCSGAKGGICSPWAVRYMVIGVGYLLAELWEGQALVGERRVVHNVPVKHIELVVSHDILERNRNKDEHALSLLKGHLTCQRKGTRSLCSKRTKKAKSSNAPQDLRGIQTPPFKHISTTKSCRGPVVLLLTIKSLFSL